MNEAYTVWRSIPADIVIIMALFVGAIARLARDEHVSAWAAAKEFYWALVVGASLTGFVIWLGDWELKTGWWVALGAPMACSMVVEIAHKKAEQLRDMDLKDTIVFIFDEIKKRITKTPPTP